MVIGTRTLTVDVEGGQLPVAIRIFAPEFDGPLWNCRYEIDWPEGLWKSHVQGNDALHALHLAMQKIGTDLYLSRYHHERRMWWIKPWVGYGFPMPRGPATCSSATTRSSTGRDEKRPGIAPGPRSFATAVS